MGFYGIKQIMHNKGIIMGKEITHGLEEHTFFPTNIWQGAGTETIHRTQITEQQNMK